ncbi:MAG TPA: DUF2092 domain-containing protein [Acidobacteriota bacterium]|nr:DUF2092 domain-containing protein [Acidobacteriota bacterium]
MKCMYKYRFLVAALIFLFVAGIARSQGADAAKGELLLKAMSQKLAAAQSFSFSTSEFHDVMKLNGQKAKLHMTREVLVRRPNGFWTRYTGDRDWEIWYDGKLLTGISGEKKVYIQHEMPPTLDETMDMLAMRFNLDLPVSDVLYSSPYDAFLDAQSRGGLVGKETINGLACNHLAYTGTAVDWQLWIDEKNSLPCRLEMTYKKATAPQFYRITFSKWNLSARVKEDAFAFKIPQGYVRIPMLERVLLQKGGAAQTQTAPSNNP